MRCEHPSCNKKITMIMKTTNQCQCQKTFCNIHRLPDDHLCDFNHKQLAREKLNRDLIQITPTKVKQI